MKEDVEKEVTVKLFDDLGDFISEWRKNNVYTDDVIINASARFAVLTYILHNKKSLDDIILAAPCFGDCITKMIEQVVVQIQQSGENIHE
jgi:hypothetical protein